MKSSDAEKSVQKESPHMQFVSKQRIVAESKHQQGNLGHKASFVAKKYQFRFSFTLFKRPVQKCISNAYGGTFEKGPRFEESCQEMSIVIGLPD